MIAMIAEVAPAPPNPCTKRATIRTVWFDAMPQTAEAMVKMATPTRKIRRRPIRSPSRPANSRKLPKLIR